MNEYQVERHSLKIYTQLFALRSRSVQRTMRVEAAGRIQAASINGILTSAQIAYTHTRRL